MLITGGAGFIGSHLADELLAHGHRVRALDALDPQVHGDGGRPAYLSAEVELVQGDVRDPRAVSRALDGVDVVYHFAARVGVGQSMYEIAEYQSVNAHGTGVLLEALLDRPVEKLVVASSMSVYGEGAYVDTAGRACEALERSRAQLERGEWEPRGANGEELRPVATPETKQPALASIYALGKYDQERMCLIFGSAYGVPTVALRFFNVYGTRQALSNPYTGVLAIFASRLLNGRKPLVFEDGRQRRDFVSVHDVASACRLALERPDADGRVLNVGSGRSVSVLEIFEELRLALDADDAEVEITGKARAGDIRHCFADIGLARELLGYRPQVELGDGLRDLAEWLEGQVAEDRVDSAAQELASRGLTL
ncbi:MAG TPA: NAD-dependent epimerase/dehydratase family protein [Gaiellaceae bacterium]|nr:NAD-dependent epimerase/dehydratase family protein [Gaiellaceae bacterium]